MVHFFYNGSIFNPGLLSPKHILLCISYSYHSMHLGMLTCLLPSKFLGTLNFHLQNRSWMFDEVYKYHKSRSGQFWVYCQSFPVLHACLIINKFGMPGVLYIHMSMAVQAMFSPHLPKIIIHTKSKHEDLCHIHKSAHFLKVIQPNLFLPQSVLSLNYHLHRRHFKWCSLSFSLCRDLGQHCLLWILLSKKYVWPFVIMHHCLNHTKRNEAVIFLFFLQGEYCM